MTVNKFEHCQDFYGNKLSPCINMSLFRRKSEKSRKTSSISLYGRGRSQTPPCIGERNLSKIPSSPDENQQPFLAFAEVTYDPSLPMRSKSRLSKTFIEVLEDNAALAYFIQFMESKNTKHLVKFWLDAESFRVSVSTRLKGLDDSIHERSSIPAPLAQSDSSGCISEKSDDVFHHSSHQKNCDSLKTYRNNTCSNTTSDFSSQNSLSSKPSLLQSSETDNCSTLSQAVDGIAQETTKLSSIDTLDGNELYDGECTVIGDCETLSNCNDVHVVNRGKQSDDMSEDVETAHLSCDIPVPKGGLVRLQTSIEQDAKAIYDKYIDTGAQTAIGVGEDLHNQMKSNIFDSNGRIEAECFVLAQEFVVKKMDEEYFPSFLRSTFHCKHQIDVLTSGNVYLADVLYNDSALFYFMEFVEQENVRHLVDFLLMSDNFQQHLISQGTYDGLQAQNDAMILYDKYFSLQATSSLGFSDSIRYEVEQNICREEGPLPECFIKPVMILTQFIEKTYLLQFLSSQLYFKYITECIITIQSGEAGISVHQKPCSSESGSEQSLSLSTVNTLLAMDGKQPGSSTSSKVLKNIDDKDMRIDTGQFKPDSLWQRPNAGKLLMAHIDKLGRVVTEFEPEPDRRKESRISKAVKKLVNREEDKNQEDMAWQVAEMIVNEICSVTMSDKFTKISETMS